MTRLSDFTLKAEAAAGPFELLRARCVIGADGAKSEVARQCVPDHDKGKFVRCVADTTGPGNEGLRMSFGDDGKRRAFG